MIATEPASLPVELAALIRDVGRGLTLTHDLDAGEAQALFGAVLDGALPPLEVCALLLAYRIKGESADELTGFMAALDERVAPLDVVVDRPRPVVLPTYSGVRRLPNLTPLLALLLRRYGVPVLVHGVTEEGWGFGRVSTAAVLSELGIHPVASAAEAQRRLAREAIAYVPIELLAPELARLLALRAKIGLRSSAHTLAKLIDPFGGAGFRVVGLTSSEYRGKVRAYLAATRADALLLRGAEGEPFADPRGQSPLECFAAGVATVSVDEDIEEAPPSAALSASDASTTAAWIASTLAGEHPIPLPILNQLGFCIRATLQPV